MSNGARISACGAYRYRLDRDWGGYELGKTGAVNFVMLNPSTADERINDPTIRRCMDFAWRWDYSRMIVTNLYALRSTNPVALLRHPDPIGPDNDDALIEAAREAKRVVCAWGAHEAGKARGVQVAESLLGVVPFLYVIRWTKAGRPAHPLYLPGNLDPKPWALGAAA